MNLRAERRLLNPRLELLNKEQVKSLQFGLLKKQLAHVAATNPFYQRLFQRQGVDIARIATLEEFRRSVPLIEKKDLIEDQNAAPPWGTRLSVPDRDIGQVFVTSGTSGLGQENHALTHADMEMSGSCWGYQCHWAGLVPGDRVFQTFPVALQSAGVRGRRTMEKFGLNVFQVSIYDSETKLDFMRRYQPHAFVAAPAYLTRLRAVCDEMGFVPRRDVPTLKTVLITGGAYSVEWAQDMQDFWGVKFTEWYGSTQSGVSQCFTCEHGVLDPDGKRAIMHNLDHRVLLEVIDPETGEQVAPGEEGDAVVTNLFREASPMIRFRTYDRVRYLPSGYCGCGRPFDGIEAGTVSRYDDMLKLRGVNTWPETIDGAVFTFPEVEEYAGRVWMSNQGTEEIAVRVELKPQLRPGSPEAVETLLRAIAARLRERTGLRMDIEEVAHESLPRFTFKVRRWTDERQTGLKVVKYTE